MSSVKPGPTYLGAVGASLEEQLHDAGVVCLHGVHERREAHGVSSVSSVPMRVQRDEVPMGVQEGDGDLGFAKPAGDAERGQPVVVDGVAGCEGQSMETGWSFGSPRAESGRASTITGTFLRGKNSFLLKGFCGGRGGGGCDLPPPSRSSVTHELPRAAGVGVAIRPAADGDAQRGFPRPAHPVRQFEVHVGAAVSQQREDIGVVVLGPT